MNSSTSAELKHLYQELKNIELPEDIQKSLSAPLLLSVGEQWKNSEKRILIVGQETQGWGNDEIKFGSFQSFKNRENSIEELADAYRHFCFGKNSSHNRSPFWSAYRSIAKIGNSDLKPDTNILWTNLVRCDYDGKSILTTNENLQNNVGSKFKGVLKREIEILQPTQIIFFTGPRYDRFLIDEFPDIKMEKFNNKFNERTLSKFLISNNIKSIRTYHPSFLRRSKKWDEIIEEIIKNDFLKD